MLFILIASLLSWYTIQLNKPNTVDVSPVENVEMSNPNSQKKSKPVTATNVEQLDLWIQEEDNSELLDEENALDVLNEENDGYFLDEENYPNDEYEEIIFYDDFDKEYWDGTEDNYLEE